MLSLCYSEYIYVCSERKAKYAYSYIRMNILRPKHAFLYIMTRIVYCVMKGKLNMLAVVFGAHIQR